MLPLDEHLATTLALLHELCPDIKKEREQREKQAQEKQKDSQK